MKTLKVLVVLLAMQSLALVSQAYDPNDPPVALPGCGFLGGQQYCNYPHPDSCYCRFDAAHCNPPSWKCCYTSLSLAVWYHPTWVDACKNSQAHEIWINAVYCFMSKECDNCNGSQWGDCVGPGSCDCSWGNIYGRFPMINYLYGPYPDMCWSGHTDCEPVEGPSGE
jgi:hypothetical protein